MRATFHDDHSAVSSESPSREPTPQPDTPKQSSVHLPYGTRAASPQLIYDTYLASGLASPKGPSPSLARSLSDSSHYRSLSPVVPGHGPTLHQLESLARDHGEFHVAFHPLPSLLLCPALSPSYHSVFSLRCARGWWLQRASRERGRSLNSKRVPLESRACRVPFLIGQEASSPLFFLLASLSSSSFWSRLLRFSPLYPFIPSVPFKSPPSLSPTSFFP